jgi:hypothetical protein
MDVGEVSACLIVFKESKWLFARLRGFWLRCSSASPSSQRFIRNDPWKTGHHPGGTARRLPALNK